MLMIHHVKIYWKRSKYHEVDTEIQSVMKMLMKDPPTVLETAMRYEMGHTSTLRLAMVVDAQAGSGRDEPGLRGRD